MNKLVIAVIGLIFATQLGFAQTTTPGGAFDARYGEVNPPLLQKFDLDFRGGNPKELVVAIEKAMGKPLNAIVPDEAVEIQIPAFKLREVTVSELFAALEQSSQKRVPYLMKSSSGQKAYQERATFYGFKTLSAGPDAVWFFHYNKVNEPPAFEDVCRFWQLGGYLKDYKIEDITTAVQTGWKLLGIKNPPTLKFHPETKLLIATGQTDELALIDSVLTELDPNTPIKRLLNPDATSPKP